MHELLSGEEGTLLPWRGSADRRRVLVHVAPRQGGKKEVF